MTKILIISLLIIMAFGIFLFCFIRAGEALAQKWPNTGYTRWWRRNFIDQNPWEK